MTYYKYEQGYKQDAQGYDSLEELIDSIVDTMDSESGNFGTVLDDTLADWISEYEGYTVLPFLGEQRVGEVVLAFIKNDGYRGYTKVLDEFVEESTSLIEEDLKAFGEAYFSGWIIATSLNDEEG